MSEAVKKLTKETKKKEGEKDAKITTKEVVSVGMFAAVLAVLSQISLPMPSGVPVTLQSFAVALTGVVLAWKLGAWLSIFCLARWVFQFLRDSAAEHRCL